MTAVDTTPEAAPRRLRGASLAVLVMVAVTASWASTFVVIQGSVARMPVTGFNAARFAVAAAVLVLLRPRALLALDRGGVLRGVLLGLALAGTYLLQTWGLQYTSTTVSAFVTGMFVVFTPLITAVVLRRRLPIGAWMAMVLAVAGLGLLTLRGFSVGFGELLTLGCALCLAVQIVGTGEWVVGRDPYALVLVQMITVTVVCGIAAAPSGFVVVPPDTGAWLGVLYTGVVATALGIVLQTWCQIRISATRIAIVMTSEPVFAALIGRLIGEELTALQLVGAALVLVSMFVVELGAAPAPPQNAGPAPTTDPQHATAQPGAPDSDSEPAARDGVPRPPPLQTVRTGE
ncbi:membrane protein [Streptomyces glebosus]|uniref:Membrane protein n=1 Tax=Streptomyces glebosus TaxID=249580 RepID=A0A640T7V9_9ACTN|nr:DMT family transporter [Streptomyces glebosus]GFE18346.1 membrane protein [Streptomyces glebosus]GHG58218.1 membrane protein [Streptomyces glebosus]